MAARSMRRVSEFAYTEAGTAGECAYCGDLATCVDHAVPKHFVAGNIRLQLACTLVKVPACLECNGIASDVVDETFFDRRRRIAKRLRHKHRAILHCADWEDAERHQLGRALRDYIESGAQKRKLLMARLLVLESYVLPAGVDASLLPEGYRRRSLRDYEPVILPSDLDADSAPPDALSSDGGASPSGRGGAPRPLSSLVYPPGHKSTKYAPDDLTERVLEMLSGGMCEYDIAKSLNIKPFVLTRVKKLLIQEGLIVPFGATTCAASPRPAPAPAAESAHV